MIVLVALVSALGGRDGASHHGGSVRLSGSPGSRARALAGVRVAVSPSGRLPAPVQDAAVAPVSATGALLLGGLDQAEASLGDILRVSASGAVRVGALPSVLHDASASSLGGETYLFGGGVVSSFSGILRVSSTGETQPAGQLPTPASDLATATLAGTVYIVGGYTGQIPLRTILAWRPGGAPARVVGTLPKPLRYAAVGVQGGQIVIAGGTSGVMASEDVYRFDPTTGRVETVGRLPHPLTHAAGVVLKGTMLVVGGREAAPNSQTRQILAISANGAVRLAGVLPLALSDLAAVTLGERVLLAGGRDRGGRVQDAILTLSSS